MRLDKFLKVSRIIKRRTIAKMVVDEKKQNWMERLLRQVQK
ncbi:hypothetical protein HMPREF9466_03113 [Fusobacterium necrophorum subsp. funduliforme 1_1_36S]|nr:hypothetical protein HMPREF9466_03113 [Fusobacterium necrophorum subsp. funduliforme 1_1_36S]